MTSANQNPTKRGRIAVLYHYLHPDDVVSARHFDGLCTGLVDRGWVVDAYPSNRACREKGARYPRRETWRGITYRRVWRPDWPQHRNWGRILNSLWMIVAWSLLALRRPKYDVVLVGTDPMFCTLVAPAFKLFSPGTHLTHWVFDMHPDCSVADGDLGERTILVRLVRKCLRMAYPAFDSMVDIGSCMRRRLKAYGPRGTEATIVPWALQEPGTPPAADAAVRESVFGDARLCILYSGSFGRAHSYQPILDLARQLRNEPIQIVFAARGNCLEMLKETLTPEDSNISFAGFVPEDQLVIHLAAADIHIASLFEKWTGLVVPSKFFGSLAIGRPVIFVGSESSSIAENIREHDVGWVLGDENVTDLAQELTALAKDPARLSELQRRAHRVYQESFCYERMLNAWDQLLVER